MNQSLPTITRGQRGRRQPRTDAARAQREAAAPILIDLRETVASYLCALDDGDREVLAEEEEAIEQTLTAALIGKQVEVLRRIPIMLDPIRMRWGREAVLGDPHHAEQEVGAWLARRALPVRALELLGAEWCHEPSLEERRLARERMEPHLIFLIGRFEDSDDPDEYRRLGEEIAAITDDDEEIGYVAQ